MNNKHILYIKFIFIILKINNSYKLIVKIEYEFKYIYN